MSTAGELGGVNLFRQLIHLIQRQDKIKKNIDGGHYGCADLFIFYLQFQY